MGDAVEHCVATLRTVSKTYGAVEALAGATLSVAAGEIVALLGPNGAGKSTALNVLTGLRRPDAGEARLFGLDPRRPEARAQIGVTPQETALPESLKVREIIDFVRSHYPAPLTVKEVLERFDLGRIANRQAGGLSGGQKRKVAVALAFTGGAPAVFLDEPTTGLDPSARSTMWQGVRDYVSDGGTVLLTTHYLEEAEALASRVVLIDGGRVMREGSVADIKASVGMRIVRFDADVPPELPGVVKVTVSDKMRPRSFTFHVRDADAAVRALVKSGTVFHNLEVLPVSLEEAIFVAPEAVL